MWDIIKTLGFSDVVIIILLLIVAGWQVGRWVGDKIFRNKMWDRQEKFARELENLKAEYGKKQTIHSIAFKTEFEVYMEIWKAVVSLQGLAPITPSVDFGPGGQEQEKLYEERLGAAFTAFGKSESIVELNKPFYSLEIYNLARTLNRDCFKHLRRIRRRLKTGNIEQCFEMADELQKNTKHVIKQIEEAIRKRVGILDKAEVVG